MRPDTLKQKYQTYALTYSFFKMETQTGTNARAHGYTYLHIPLIINHQLFYCNRSEVVVLSGKLRPSRSDLNSDGTRISNKIPSTRDNI